MSVNSSHVVLTPVSLADYSKLSYLFEGVIPPAFSANVNTLESPDLIKQIENEVQLVSMSSQLSGQSDIARARAFSPNGSGTRTLELIPLDSYRIDRNPTFTRGAGEAEISLQRTLRRRNSDVMKAAESTEFVTAPETEVVEEVPVTTTTTTTTTTTVEIPEPTFGQKFIAIILLAITTPMLLNFLLAVSYLCSTAYYKWMFLVPQQATATFFDRTTWAVIFFSGVWLSDAIVTVLIAIITQYASAILETTENSWSNYERDNKVYLTRKDAIMMSFGDFGSRTWNWLQSNIWSIRSFFVNIPWVIHFSSRFLAKYVIYVISLYFVVTLISSQLGIPIEYGPSAKSSIYGPLISGLYNLVLPMTGSMGNLWNLNGAAWSSYFAGEVPLATGTMPGTMPTTQTPMFTYDN